MIILGLNRTDARLALNFFRINLRDKYLGSALGSIWAVANPLLQLGIFTYVFGFVYKIRLPGAETTLAYSIWLIGGYGPWIALQESIMACALCVVSSAPIVKNMAFKTEVLPFAAALTGIVPLTVSMLFLSLLLIADGNPPTWHAILIVPIVALQFLFVASLGFFLAAVTVFVRDLAIVLPNLLFALLFATPIFYPVESTPAILRGLSKANPFYIIPESYRTVMIYHKIPDPWALAYVAVISAALSIIGIKVFRRVKGYFGAML
jgi:lipopolysaccharide transport system permease protein